MSDRKNAKQRDTLAKKSEALRELIDDAAPLVPAEELARLHELDERVARRSELSAQHTVVGFFGATGSGKSSLLNAVTGVEIARVAHRRPTTSQALAAIVDDPKGTLVDDAHALLDWLEISERHIVNHHTGAPGVIYVDLPDFDSVEKSNREVAERLAERVDVLVWVTDPEKYADGILHAEFVRKFAAHEAVTLAVLNQADRLSADDREQVRQSLEDLMKADGLRDVKALTVSAMTGSGLEDLRAECERVAGRKNAALVRIQADLDAEARRSAALLGATETKKSFVVDGLASTVTETAVSTLEDAIADAAHVSQIGRAVGASYRQRAARNTGWPPLRWLGGFKVDPLARMHIGRSQKAADEEGRSDFVSRSSLDLGSPLSLGRMNRGFDAFLDDIVGYAPHPWPARLREVTEPERERLPDIADEAITRTPIKAQDRSWWWSPLNVLQWLALLCVVAGLGWLLALAAFDFLQIPKPPMPVIEGLWIPVPVPTALIAFGALAGILIALGAGFVNRAVANSRAARAQRDLRQSIRGSVLESVGSVAGEECERATRIERNLGALRNTR